MSDPRLRTRHAVILAWFLLLLVVPTAPAAAGPHSPDDGCLNDGVCLGHYNHAVKLFEGGRFELALTEFQAAYRRRQMPWLLVNIGRTLHRLGRLKEAIAHYERYQQSGLGTDPETSQKAREYLAQARLLLAQAAQADDLVENDRPAPDRGEGEQAHHELDDDTGLQEQGQG